MSQEFSTTANTLNKLSQEGDTASLEVFSNNNSQEVAYIPNTSNALIEIHKTLVVTATQEGRLDLIQLLLGSSINEQVGALQKIQEYNEDVIWGALLSIRLTVLLGYIEQFVEIVKPAQTSPQSNRANSNETELKIWDKDNEIFGEILNFLKTKGTYPSDKTISRFLASMKTNLANMVVKYPRKDSVQNHKDRFQTRMWEEMLNSQELKGFKSDMRVSGGRLKERFDSIMNPVEFTSRTPIQMIIYNFLESGANILKQMRELRDKIPSAESGMNALKEKINISYDRQLQSLSRNTKPFFKELLPELTGGSLKDLQQPLKEKMDISKIRNNLDENKGLLEILCVAKGYNSSNSKGCYLHFLPSFPELPIEYNGSFILVKRQQLNYIRHDGGSEEVLISDFGIFLLDLSDLNPANINSILLEEDQIYKLITKNGGYERPNISKSFDACAEYITNACLALGHYDLIHEAFYLRYKYGNNPEINEGIINKILATLTEFHRQSPLQILKIKPSLFEDTVLTHSQEFIKQKENEHPFLQWFNSWFHTKEEWDTFLKEAHQLCALTNLGNEERGDEVLAMGLQLIRKRPTTWMEYFKSFIDPHSPLLPLAQKYKDTSNQGSESIGYICGLRQAQQNAERERDEAKKEVEEIKKKLQMNENKLIQKKNEKLENKLRTHENENKDEKTQRLLGKLKRREALLKLNNIALDSDSDEEKPSLQNPSVF